MTDYAQKQVGKKDNHHNQIGMALDVKLKVDEMIEIEKNSKEANDIVSFIKPIFSNMETDEIAREAAARGLNELTGYPLTSEERAKVQLTVKDLNRSRYSFNDGRQIYYLAIEKEYKRSGTSTDSFSCNDISFLYTWVLKNKDGTLTALNESFGLTDCDGKARGSIVVLFSVMPLNNRTFIFTVEHGWEDENYVIYELTEFEISRLLETFGG